MANQFSRVDYLSFAITNNDREFNGVMWKFWGSQTLTYEEDGGMWWGLRSTWVFSCV